MIICTITTASHLFRARVMAASAKKHHPEAKVVVCLIEKKLKRSIRQKHAFDQVVLAKNLGVPNFDKFIFKHNVHEASFVLKGHFLKYLVRTHPHEHEFIFLDTDIQVLGPMVEVQEALKHHSVVLTPHEVYDAKESYQFHGIYNIGFIAINRSEDSMRFLDWWIARGDRFCYDQYQAIGLFYEQGWLDLAPTYFNVHTLLHPGYNIAFWNMRERGQAIFKYKSGHYSVNGLPVRFFHFSNVHGALLSSIHQYVPASHRGLRLMCKAYTKQLRKPKKSISWSYDFYSNGTRIMPEARYRYRVNAQLEQMYSNPFDQSNRAFLPELREHVVRKKLAKGTKRMKRLKGTARAGRLRLTKKAISARAVRPASISRPNRPIRSARSVKPTKWVYKSTVTKKRVLTKKRKVA